MKFSEFILKKLEELGVDYPDDIIKTVSPLGTKGAAQYLIDIGQLTEKEAESFPSRNVITRAVGTEPTVTPECFRENAADGTFVLLCSDGLTNFVKNDEIRTIIAKDSKNIDQIALGVRVNKLIDTANKNGGADNITAAVIKI